MTNTYPFINYRVFFTPLIGSDEYGATVDVTKDIDLTDWLKSVGFITREIDNGDYDIGIFTFGDITINAINFDRKFNDEKDSLSIFPYKRDLCKVEIVFYEEDGTSSSRFKGLINDDATRIDFQNDLVKFKVLSQDSIFRQVNVPDGAIVAGDLFSTAIKKILNVPAITSVVTYDPSNVSVDLDIAIDDGEVFSNTVVKDSLDQLLLASNSILFVDKNDEIQVKPRTESATIFKVHGRGDLYGRDEILKIANHNNGLQRSYNSIAVNDDTVITNDAWVAEYGFRQKTVSFDFITTSSKEEQIANSIIDEFNVPKDELEITVPTKCVLGIDLLDIVRIDYDYRARANPEDDKIPMYGEVSYDETHYAITVGSMRILPKEKWKVTAIDESVKDFTTKLRLRRAGKTTSDGYFHYPSLDFSKFTNSQYLPLI